MSKEAWLLMRCTSESDTVLVVAHLPSGFVETMEKRRRDLVEMSVLPDHSGVSGLMYWYSVDAYEMPDVGEIFKHDEVIEEFDSQDWVCALEKPDTSDIGDELRIEGCELSISAVSDQFYWSFVPKHGTTTYETPGVSIRDMKRELE